MAKINYDKHVWEGWTVADFINSLNPQIETIMNGGSWHKPFTSKKELADWCRDNQPYYKKSIPDVVKHFANAYGLK